MLKRATKLFDIGNSLPIHKEDYCHEKCLLNFTNLFSSSLSLPILL